MIVHFPMNDWGMPLSVAEQCSRGYKHHVFFTTNWWLKYRSLPSPHFSVPPKASKQTNRTVSSYPHSTGKLFCFLLFPIGLACPCLAGGTLITLHLLKSVGFSNMRIRSLKCFCRGRSGTQSPLFYFQEFRIWRTQSKNYLGLSKQKYCLLLSPVLSTHTVNCNGGHKTKSLSENCCPDAGV